MPTLSVVNFNIVCATLGGFITLFGLVSYLLKEKYYLSEARKYPAYRRYCRSCVDHSLSDFSGRRRHLFTTCSQPCPST